MQRTLLTVATGWGTRHGGINAFNYDFLRGFAAAFVNVKVICVVPEMTRLEHDDAYQSRVELRALPYKVASEQLNKSLAIDVFEKLCGDIRSHDIVCLGHDVFTGALVVELSKLLGARSAVIHHMSYDTYKGYESDSSSIAQVKTKIQKEIFADVQIPIAIGPSLRDELTDWLGPNKAAMLIPGLPEIEPGISPLKWTTILFGRLNPDTNRVKQTKLGIVSAARCERDGRLDAGLARKLRDGTRIKIYGGEEKFEGEYRALVEAQIGAVMDIHVLPYTENRNELFDELRRASVALMPSWHEGFGLVGWEAIAAGVPVILGSDSGVYKFLKEFYPGVGTGCVVAIDIRGSQHDPHYQEDDANDIVKALKEIAADEVTAKKKALNLRTLLREHTPKRCAEEFSEFVGWGAGCDPEPTIGVINLEVDEQSPSSTLLIFPAPHWDVKRGQSYSQLLRAEEACVPYFNHEGVDQLSSLMGWVNSKIYPLMISVYTGAGGVGKTRLLIEGCRIAKESGINAGFLKSNFALSELKAQFENDFGKINSWLIVVDYAETRRDHIATIVEVAQNYPSSQIRIVLLAREAGEWWDRLAMDYPQCESIFSGPATSSPKTIPPLHSDLPARSQAYTDAIYAYAKRLEILEPQRFLEVLPNLEGEHFNRPLFLQMAALLALHGERADSPNGLVDGILRHEFRYWRAINKSQSFSSDERVLAQLMTFATLTGGLATERDAWEILKRAGILLPAKAEFSKIFRSICTLYPGRQGLQPLQPDLLGEALVAASIITSGGDFQIDAAVSGSTAECDHALTVLARSLGSRPTLTEPLHEALSRKFLSIWRQVIKVGRETGGTIAKISCDVFEKFTVGQKLQIASSILDELETSSLQWDPLALLASNSIVESYSVKLSRVNGTKKDVVRRAYAMALVTRSIAKNFLGDHDGAQLDAKESIFELRRCNKATDEALADYANSLNNASNRACALRKFESAIQYSEEATKIFKELYERDAVKFLGVYAGALGNYASTYGGMSRYDLALEYSEKVLALSEPLRDDSNFNNDNKGVLLRNMALYYCELNKPAQGLQAALDAVGIYKPLFANRSDRYSVEYASALTRAAYTHAVSKNYQEAIRLANEAAEILSPIAVARIETYGEEFASVKHLLSSFHLQVGEWEASNRCNDKAFEVLSLLWQKKPLIYGESYSSVLSLKADLLAYIGNYPEAFKFINRAQEATNDAFQDKLHAKALSPISLKVWSVFYKWLAGINIDIEEFLAEVHALGIDLPDHFRLSADAEILFVRGCVVSSTSRFEALHFFENFVLLYDDARILVRIELENLFLIAMHYISTMSPAPENLYKFKQKYISLIETSGCRFPSWIFDAIRKLGLPSLGAEMDRAKPFLPQ